MILGLAGDTIIRDVHSSLCVHFTWSRFFQKASLCLGCCGSSKEDTELGLVGGEVALCVSLCGQGRLPGGGDTLLVEFEVI